MRALFGASLLALVAASAHANTVTTPFTITVNAGSVSACPDDDGSAGATPGAANLPAALAAYKDVNTIHARGCKVAGVDFHVGLSSAIALRAPTSTNLPKGCSLGGNVVSCLNDANPVFSGYDMTGKQLDVSGANVTISGNRWNLTSNCLAPITYAPSGTWHIEGNSFQGNGGTTCVNGLANGFSGMVYNAGGTAAATTVYVRWNEFLNTPEDTLNFAGPDNHVGAITPIVNFNYWNGQGWVGHPDGIQFTGGNFNGTKVLHNTYVNTRLNVNPGTQPLHLEAQLTSAVTDSTTAFNTMITPGSCKGGSAWPNPGDPPPYHCSINFDFACKNDTGTSGEKDSNTSYKIYGNYVDATGAIAATATQSYACTQTSSGTPFANVDMTTGGSLANVSAKFQPAIKSTAVGGKFRAARAHH